MTHSKQLPDFSARELGLIQDNEIFPLKFSVIQKISELFLLLEEALKDKAIDSHFPFPGKCQHKGGKISRGENLKGFPWVVLDYPRHIQNKDLFLFRTQCWFGHGFTCSLIVQGKPMELLPAVCPDGFQFAVNEHIWNSDPVANIWDYNREFPVYVEAIRFMKDLETMNPIRAMEEVVRIFSELLRELE